MRSRFVLFVVIIALIPPSLALVSTSEAGANAEEDMELRGWSALTALTDKLDSEAALRRETLLRIIALPEVTSIVRESAGSDRVPTAELVARVRTAVNDLFRDQAPELIAVVNQAGGQVVVTRSEPKPVEVEALAPAAAALSGQMAVTYSKFDGKFYRLTAAPVGVSDAAIVLGDRIAESSVARLKENIRADVIITLGGKPLVSSANDAALGQTLATSRAEGTVRSGKLELGLPSIFDKIFPIWVPREKYASLGHALSPVARGAGGRGVKDPGAPVAWVTVTSRLGWAGRAQVAAFVAALVIFAMGLLWIPVIYGPVFRQARSIEAHLARLRVERTLRLTKRGFTNPFSAIAELLDKLADDWNKDYSPPPVREVPAVSDGPRPIIQRPPVELPLQSPPPAAPPPETAAAFPFQDDPHATSTGRQKITGKQKVSSDVAQEARTEARISVVAKPEPRASSAPTPVATEVAPPDRELSGPIPLPGASSMPGGARNGVPRPGPAEGADGEVPADLLARSQELEREMLGGANAEADADNDDLHFQSIFDEFLATRLTCGEGNEGLTFEKFATRLRKNRDQLIEKYKCRSVRFQVYVKDGKAAVKAVPVR